MGKFRTGRWTLGEVRDGSGDIVLVQNGSAGSQVVLQRVGGPSGRFETGRGTLGEVRGGVGRSGMGRGTLGKVRNGLETLG